MFIELVEHIGDDVCSDSVQVASELIIIGKVTSIGSADQWFTCPKRYSLDIKRDYPPSKCTACKTRPLYLENNVNHTEIKLDITDNDAKTSELVLNVSNIRLSLEKMDRNELCKEDLIEQERVLLALSSIHVCANFNSKDKHINSIVIHRELLK